MGVHDLWSIVEPVRESVPLYSLSGKTLAVDLSLWVCEAQHVQAMMGRVTRPHLRNLFFRVSSLTLMGVKLVFVMEGEAPKLKAETMTKRTEKRFGGFKKAAAPKCTTNPSRGRFKAVLRECSEMLDYLGVPWVTAAGEAEAMCAFLDSQGLVDGCITNDGDAFLYGARTVYRNFNMNTKDPQVDCYKTSRVETELHLSRENLVGLAILLGCDYIPKGIPGVGREQALKLIHTLKGQTLLQKFTQWKEKNTGVSEGVVKKVPHCHICRHPGSAKAHERGGCVLCDSQKFCQPQDFDYQCPCDWHRHEQRRQAMAVEANVRKKTLENQQFPFTEIISEFLVSKDKPVSNFKRRQPNMLSMQKFASDKMEWPKHYTSEKVLVLMTYVELMNRKYGRKMTSQIKPLRIWKPRVRSGVACYEVIWSTPDHYVFPEDQPAEDQHEVRSVEEESLFRVAFPEVVERYMSDKALAEENKTKKKKPKTKKEKTPDGQNDISDLLAQMTLQSAPSEEAASRPQTLPLPVSNVGIPEVIVMDTPVSNRHQNRQEATPETAASPSVSAVIEALHLSDIDWDATSFSASPPPQSAAVHLTEPKRSIHTPDEEKAPKDIQEEKVSSDLCYTECSLRERVLMRNTTRAQNTHNEVPKQLGYDSSSSHNFKPSAQKSSEDKNTEPSTTNMKEPLKEKAQCLTNTAEAQTGTSKPHFKPVVQNQSKKVEACKDSQKPQKYKFVKVAVQKATTKVRSNSAESDKDRSAAQTSKKSVCRSACSSSEDSDVENQQHGPQRRGKAKIKGSLLQDVPLKPVFAPKSAKSAAPLLGPKYVPQSPDVKINSVPASAKSQDGTLPCPSVDVAPRTPASPIVVSDSEDSVICGDSPLPLAERMRLKFLN